jgi:hypothetical protein
VMVQREGELGGEEASRGVGARKDGMGWYGTEGEVWNGTEGG